jgi:tetratricopeptide (TPR) repeat protein
MASKPFFILNASLLLIFCVLLCVPISAHAVSREDAVRPLLDEAKKAENDKNSAEERRLYIEVLKQDPQNQEAREGIARLRLEALDKVVQKFKQSLKDENLNQAQNYLDKIAKAFPHEERLSDWKDQLIELRANVKAKRTKGQAAYRLGYDSYKTGDYPQAKRFWKEALEADTNNVSAQKGLDWINKNHPVPDDTPTPTPSI